jgi:ribosomal protein S18 acetylase RimI-like enzyme
MADSLIATTARLVERAPAFRLVFQHLTGAEREARISNALRFLRQGELDPAGIIVVRGDTGLLGAMVCVPVAGASALVWPPQAVPGSRRRQVEDLLLSYAVAWLRRRGAKLAQALLSTSEIGLAEPLERNGFAHITGLWYLRHDLSRLPPSPPEPTRLTLQTYTSCDQARFHQTLLETYEGTFDCPEVNGVRDLKEILEGHRSQGQFDSNRWWLAADGDQAVGVLLMTQISEWQGWDVSYFGVVPRARRRGIGSAIMRKGLLEAQSARATQLTLAVDMRNVPATKLYSQLGFERFDTREVYLAIWNSPPDHEERQGDDTPDGILD